MSKSTRRTTVLAAGIALAATAAFAGGTQIVDEDINDGWAFGRDLNNVTEYEFTVDQSVIGTGSLHVLPITNSINGNGDKFIAELSAEGTTTDAFDEFSIDFMVEGGGATAYKQFYINVYAIGAGSSQGYADCVYDYVASSGSTSAFTTLSTSAPANSVRNRTGFVSCGASLGDMPAGSTVNFFAVNVGDTSATDQGVGGYLDNAVLTIDGVSTTFDFEPMQTAPTTKDDCKKGGWEAFGFRNQGECVSSVQANGKAGKG